MAKVRHIALVVLSVALVLTTGTLGLVLTARANTKAETLLLRDRKTLQSSLASLGKEYVLFALKEALDYASSGNWALTPGNASDQARLRSFVDQATFLNYGAALVTPAGRALDAYSTGPGLPPESDPGYGPMIKALLASKPDVSAVMKVGSVPVVAMAVPIEIAGQTKALFVGYMRLDHSNLETYVQQLRYGRTGAGYVVDSNGVVVAGPNPAAIGTSLGQSRAVAAVAHGRTGAYQLDGEEVSYAPFGVGGWSGMTVQSSSEFFGPIRSSDLHVGVALLGLLAVATVLIIVFGYRQEAVRRRYQELLAYQAYHDALTGLANRSLLFNRLNQAVARARRQGGGVALLYLDLDRFKPVNDRQGHEAGDELLVTVAERLARTVRIEDTVARIGGDEFAILMEDVDSAEAARHTAERIVDEVSQPVQVRDQQVVVGVSIGIAYSPRGEDDSESLLRDADLAMYRAKDTGRNRCVFAAEPLVVGVSARPRQHSYS